MKTTTFLVFALLGFSGALAKLSCVSNPPAIPTAWVSMVKTCTDQMTRQVQEELAASLTYLSMAAHFSRDTVNRPGFAKMYFEAASEERQHAMKLLDYLLMRGKLTDDFVTLHSTFRNLVTLPKVPKVSWDTGVQSLKDALELENKVTNSIREVIKACEGDADFNDYHLVDYLTGEFLEEQYKGQRDIAGKASTLEKMMVSHGALGEFMFDKKLME